MSEIFDFQSRRRVRLRDSASKCAEKASGLLARVEWLQRNGASLADVVRASLDARKAELDCCAIGRGMAAAATDNLPS